MLIQVGVKYDKKNETLLVVLARGDASKARVIKMNAHGIKVELLDKKKLVTK